jgi:hypothetical protein
MIRRTTTPFEPLGDRGQLTPDVRHYRGYGPGRQGSVGRTDRSDAADLGAGQGLRLRWLRNIGGRLRGGRIRRWGRRFPSPSPRERRRMRQQEMPMMPHRQPVLPGMERHEIEPQPPVPVPLAQPVRTPGAQHVGALPASSAMRSISRGPSRTLRARIRKPRRRRKAAARSSAVRPLS